MIASGTAITSPFSAMSAAAWTAERPAGGVHERGAGGERALLRPGGRERRGRGVVTDHGAVQVRDDHDGSAEARGATRAAARARPRVADRENAAARSGTGARLTTETRIAGTCEALRVAALKVGCPTSRSTSKLGATDRNVDPDENPSPSSSPALGLAACGGGDRREPKPLGSVTVTRVRRCFEEAKGGLELAWSFGVASAFQRLCETATSSRFDADVTGHTTPAVADVAPRLASRALLAVALRGRDFGPPAVCFSACDGRRASRRPSRELAEANVDAFARRDSNLSRTSSSVRLRDRRARRAGRTDTAPRATGSQSSWSWRVRS